MNRQEALTHFREKYLNPKLAEQIKAVDSYFRKNKDDLVKDFLASFQKVCSAVKEQQETQNKPPLRSINLSLLRTSLCRGEAVYRWDVYDALGSWDWEGKSYRYDAQWCIQPLHQTIPELDPIRRRYVFALIPQDLVRIRQSDIANFHLYIIQLARYSLQNVSTMPDFQAIQRENPFTIYVGEFLKDYQPVSIEPNPLIKIKGIRTRIKRKPHQCFRSLQNMDMGSEQYTYVNFSYSDLNGSDLSGCELQQGIFVGTNFQNCNLERANFSHCSIHDANFSHCNLEKANFSGTKGGVGIDSAPLQIYQSQLSCVDEESAIDRDKIPSFFGVNFYGSNLVQTDFSGADLRGADFRKAIFGQTFFQDALLHEAIFLKESQNEIELTPEQIDSICWVREE